MRLFWFTLLFTSTLLATTPPPTQKSDPDKPLFSPFIENYILNELKTLRDENRDLKVLINTELAEKELRVTDKAISYATSTMSNMFYIIAAASSILVLIGWNSLRDLNQRLKGMVNEKIQKVITEYETRMEKLEHDLSTRSQQVLKNQEDIARTNTIHSLWMRAGIETTPAGKIEIYDNILKIRPEDVEALSYKADAALEVGEANWALSLSNKALNISPNYAYALYQRACAYSALGQTESALDDLETVVNENEQYIEEIHKEPEFDTIKDDPRFIALLQNSQENSN